MWHSHRLRPLSKSASHRLTKPVTTTSLSEHTITTGRGGDTVLRFRQRPTSPFIASRSYVTRVGVASNNVKHLDNVLDWVPPAYRGVTGKGGGRDGRNHPQHRHPKHKNDPPHKFKRPNPQHQRKVKPAWIKKKEDAKVKAVRAEVQSDFDRLGVLCGELRRLLCNYRSILDHSWTDNNADRRNNVFKFSVDLSLPVRENKISKVIESVTAHVAALDALNQVHPKQLADSDDLFRGLCRVIHDVIHACCKCYKHESQKEMIVLIDCAEQCLFDLRKLIDQRKQLFDQMNRTEETREAENESKQSSWINPLSQVATYISKSISKLALNNEKKIDERLLAHNDKDLAPSQQLIRLLVESIASATATKTDGLLPNSEQRVSNLLQVLPDDTVPESRTLLGILEVLCHVGNLEAAQECRKLFDQFSSEIPHLPFSLVLRCYLEASRNETIYERKHEIVKEVLEVFKTRWKSQMPRHKEERVAHGSSVLECIAVSGISQDSRIQEEVETVVRTTLHRSEYDRFRKATESENAKVDPDVVPIFNFLARIYAVSNDATKVEKAKAMVKNILPNQGDSDGRYLKYPNVETINTILSGILRLHQEGGDNLDAHSDLDFAESLLDYAMSRRESGTWANAETFELIMNLYTILKPENVGQKMLNLVSHYETRVYLSKKPSMKISLATYNRVIWGLWEEAKLGKSPQTSQKALELLEKLEMLSTPLLLTPKQVRSLNNIDLYRLDLRPSKKTYEMVLNVCADTVAPNEFEMAARVAGVVGRRMARMSSIQPKAIDKIQSCLDRLPSDSVLVEPLNKLVTELEEKIASSEESTNEEGKTEN